MSKKFTTSLCRLSYPHIFKPAEDLNHNMKYSASLIIPKADKKTVERYKATIAALMKEPETAKTLGKGANVRMPLRDGDVDRPNDAAYANSWFLNAKSNEDHKPLVVDRDKQEIIDVNEVYPGCYVQAVVNFYAYNKGGNKGIGCSLSAIRKVKDGEPLTGAIVSDDDFDDSLLGDMTDEFF